MIIKCGTCIENGVETEATTRIRIELRPSYCTHTVPLCERHAARTLNLGLPNVTRVKL